MDRTERFYQIDQVLKDSKVVTFARFQEVLGVSRATLKRNLEYMRSRFNAPNGTAPQTATASGKPTAAPPRPAPDPQCWTLNLCSASRIQEDEPASNRPNSRLLHTHRFLQRIARASPYYPDWNAAVCAQANRPLSLRMRSGRNDYFPRITPRLFETSAVRDSRLLSSV